VFTVTITRHFTTLCRRSYRKWYTLLPLGSKRLNTTDSSHFFSRLFKETQTGQIKALLGKG